MAVKVTFDEPRMGKCSLNGDEGEGFVVTMPGLKNVFLTWETIKKLVLLQNENKKKPATVKTPRVAAS